MDGRGRIKHNDNYCKFHSYKGTNLGHGMICESVNSDQEEKERDLPNGNRIINLNNLITNIDKCLVCKEFSQERGIHIKLEQEKDQENFVDYVEACFQLTPSDEQKGIKEQHEDFNKQTHNRQKTSHHYLF